jgi:hypothetical protein
MSRSPLAKGLRAPSHARTTSNGDRRAMSPDQLAFLEANPNWESILADWCEGFDEGARSVAARPPDVTPVLLTIPEAARLASMSPRALWHMRQRGLLPPNVFVEMGRSVRVHRERFISALGKSRPGRTQRPARKALPPEGFRSDVIDGSPRPNARNRQREKG